jgi:hypothetical protein
MELEIFNRFTKPGLLTLVLELISEQAPRLAPHAPHSQWNEKTQAERIQKQNTSES